MEFILLKDDVVTAVSSDLSGLGRFASEAIEVDEGTVKIDYIRQPDGSFKAPMEQPVPLKKLTRFQFEMILELLGITQEQVFALINGLNWTDMEKLVARKKVETGGNDGRWSRENDLWNILGPSLGVTKEQIDEKWKEAQAL